MISKKYILINLLTLLIASCSQFEDYGDIQLNELMAGDDKVLINGDNHEDFYALDSVTYFSQVNRFILGFSKEYSLPLNGLTSFSFSSVDLIEGEYTLTDSSNRAERNDNFVEINISSLIGRDAEGAEYKLSNSKQSFLKISKVDMENSLVIGNFQFQMKMVDANGLDEAQIGLPQFCTVQGEFHKYF